MQKRLLWASAYVLIILAILFGSSQYSNYRKVQEQKKLDEKFAVLKPLMTDMLSELGVKDLSEEELKRVDYTDEDGSAFASIEYTFSTFSEANPFTKTPSAEAARFERILLNRGFSHDSYADMDSAFWGSQTYVKENISCDISRGVKFNFGGSPETSGEYASCTMAI